MITFLPPCVRHTSPATMQLPLLFHDHTPDAASQGIHIQLPCSSHCDSITTLPYIPIFCLPETTASGPLSSWINSRFSCKSCANKSIISCFNSSITTVDAEILAYRQSLIVTESFWAIQEMLTTEPRQPPSREE